MTTVTLDTEVIKFLGRTELLVYIGLAMKGYDKELYIDNHEREKIGKLFELKDNTIAKTLVKLAKINLAERKRKSVYVVKKHLDYREAFGFLETSKTKKNEENE